jgi:hypothetical protein
MYVRVFAYEKDMQKKQKKNGETKQNKKKGEREIIYNYHKT